MKVHRSILQVTLSPLRGVLSFFMLLTSLTSVLAQTGAVSAATGSVHGRVLNIATGNYLEGALVTLDEGNRVSTVSRGAGHFTLDGVPVGRRHLVVTYSGLDPARVQVEVLAENTPAVEISLTAEIYKLEKYEVFSVREGQALAVSRQQNADNIKNIVATDAFGSVADSNVGNLLVKLPGIAGERNEGDINKITIRGISADLNSVEVDGTRLSGATTAGAGRSFEIDKVSVDSIESVEVTKAATPDMDGDSIGGSINLKTKSAFDRKGRSLSYSLGTNYHYNREVARPSGSVSYSDVLGADQKLGVILSTSFNRTFAPRQSVRSGYANPSLTAPAPMTDLQVSDDEITLNRFGSSLRTDYKLGDRSSVFFNVMYNDYKDDMFQYKQRLRVGGGAATATPDDRVTTIANGRFDYILESRVRTVETLRLAAGGRFEFGPYMLDFDVTRSDSTGGEVREDLSLRFDRVNYVIDSSTRTNFPMFSLTGGADPTNYDQGRGDSINRKDYVADDDLTGIQVNLRRSLELSLPTYLKTGFRYRGQKKSQDRLQDVWRYVGPDGVAGLNSKTGINDDDLNRFRNGVYDQAPIGGRYASPPWPNLDALHRALDDHPELFAYNAESSALNAVEEDGVAKEDIYATYLLGNIKIDRLNLLGGVRVERTEVSATGPVIDTTETDLSKRYGGQQTLESSYTDTFPSAHFRYELGKNTQARASFSTGIGRPSFGDLMPLNNIDIDDETIRQNNTGLKPQTSKSYDVSLEHYFNTVGLISIGAFEKQISDFIFTETTQVGSGPDNGFDGKYAGFEYETQRNGGWARVRGLELNYEQQFTFLPGWLSGFGVSANYTRLLTRGNYGGTVVHDKLENFTPVLANAGISYSRSRLAIRAQVNYVGERLTDYSSNEAEWAFREARTTVDISAKYAVTKYASIFVDAFNVFNEKDIRYQGLSHRNYWAQVYGVRMSAGITGRF